MFGIIKEEQQGQHGYHFIKEVAKEAVQSMEARSQQLERPFRRTWAFYSQ